MWWKNRKTKKVTQIRANMTKKFPFPMASEVVRKVELNTSAVNMLKKTARLIARARMLGANTSAAMSNDPESTARVKNAMLRKIPTSVMIPD